MMIGQVHELVDEIWLVQVTCQRTELLVCGQSVTAMSQAHRTHKDV